MMATTPASSSGRPGRVRARTRPPPSAAAAQAFAHPRCFHGSETVYTVVSPRARGLSVGVNVNPDRHCNFDCVYCDVQGDKSPLAQPCNVEATAAQLHHVLQLAVSGHLQHLPPYLDFPEDLLRLRAVTLSGDGEPTLCPNFDEILHAVLRIRAVHPFPFFPIVLITNTSGLDRPRVRSSIDLLTRRDEIWAKLDAGTQAWMNRINRPAAPMDLDQVHARILAFGRRRPVVIQSLFPQIDNAPPPQAEIDAYTRRLSRLQSEGAQIQRVQIYSAHHPVAHPDCSHLPLRALSRIARQVRQQTGLAVDVC